MGEVYRADDLKLGQAVALKFLPRALAADPVRRERFYAEVRITRQLSHPNICRVYDIAEVDGQHFLSMEFVDGEDLAALITRIGYLPNEKALDIVRQLVSGLAAAHARGVLHRDLKPANIMVDGLGRVRITDFGLAVAASGDEPPVTDVSGTPAYMAPEQLAGKGASVRSDIYALGLVMYELTCGRIAFSASTIAELREQKEHHTPTAPSDIRAGVDPVIERLIARCLERDPRLRPASVAQIAAALPGGDPLAAAIAAGETPSPELLIATGSKEGLHPAAAVGLLFLVVVGAILFAGMNDRVGLVQRARLEKPPEALAERARQILEKTGYADGAADRAFGFFVDTDVLSYLANGDLNSRWDNLEAAGAAGFFYRQSPEPLLGLSPISGVEPNDPPMLHPGEVAVQLDGAGRLRAFHVVPPSVDSSRPPPPTPDWTTLFSEAGLDQSRWTTIEPQWNPPSYADTRAAWQGSFPDLPSVTLRIEAAAYRGKPVSFAVIGPWTPATPVGGASSGAAASIFQSGSSFAVFLAGLAILISGAIVFARANLRVGRGDRRSAARLALVVLAFSTTAWVFVEHHVAAPGEYLLFINFAGLYVPVVILLWISYIAVEPFVRRRWPRILVSWTRLLSGDWRDPLVGRDVLVGCAAGVALACLGRVELLVPSMLGYAEPTPFIPDWNFLNSTRSSVAAMIGLSITGIVLALGRLLMLFLLRVLLRHDWAAAIAFAVTLGLGLAARASLVPPNIPLGLLFGFVVVVVLLRVGLLASMLASIVFTLLDLSPMTLQTASWYFSTGFVVFLVVLAMSAYGFRTAVSGRPLLGTAGLGD
jgi:serine/threonine-protein kinase